MTKIRVGMVQLPNMLRAILCDSVGTEPDIDLVDLGNGLGTSSQRKGLEVVLVPCDSAGLRSVCAILTERPNLAVLAFNRDAKLAHLYQVHRQSLGELSADALLVTLRSIAKHPAIEHSGERP